MVRLTLAYQAAKNMHPDVWINPRAIRALMVNDRGETEVYIDSRSPFRVKEPPEYILRQIPGDIIRDIPGE